MFQGVVELGDSAAGDGVTGLLGAAALVGKLLGAVVLPALGAAGEAGFAT